MIGSAGSPEKVDWLRSLGIEAFNYREQSPREALADGIDVCFDNVGGAQLEAALNALRPFGRVIACGAISRYNDERPEPGPAESAVHRHEAAARAGLHRVGSLRTGSPRSSPRSGRGWPPAELQYRETVLDGIENVPAAFAGLFRGDNTGKMLVRVGPD